MDHEPRGKLTVEDLPKIGGEVPRSVLAGLAGMIVAGALTWLMMDVLHPSGWYALIGIPTACSVIPGLVIGLLDHRRPLVTAPLAALLFFVGFVLTQARDGVYVGMDGWAGGAALGAGFLAGLGAFVGSSVREVRYGGTTALALAAVGFVVLFVFPELAFRRDTAQFMEQRLDDAVALVSGDLVRVPATGLQWQHELVGGLFRGIELSTAWQVDTEAAGPGDCTLKVRARWLESEGELGDDIDTIEFRFQPHRPVRLQRKEEAEALLHDLGVREPPEDLQKQVLRWSVWWRPERTGRARPMYEITVEHDGRVTAKRDIPWLD